MNSVKTEQEAAEWSFLLDAAQHILAGIPLPATYTGAQALKFSDLPARAARHRMTPLLARLLAASTEGALISAEMGESLQRRSFGLAAHGSSLIGELKQLHQLFEAAGIRWLSFKGPVLSMDLYGDPLLRPCDDLDLLLHPDDLTRACDLLGRAGYRAEQQHSPGAMKERLRGNWGLDYRSPGNQHLIEIKSDLAPHFYALHFAGDLPWDNPRRVVVDDVAYPTLPPPLQTVALAAHGCWHRWERLLWILDLAKSFDRHADAIPSLMDFARERGAARMLLSGYYLGRELLERPPFPELEPGLLQDRKQVSLLCQPLKEELGDLRVQPHRLTSRVGFHLHARERFRDRARYLQRLLTASSESDWALLDLPEALAPLYRLLRPFRLMGRTIKHGIRRPPSP